MSEIKKQQIIEQEIERNEALIEQYEEKYQENLQPVSDQRKKVGDLEEEVQTLKHGFDGDETAYKEYQKQLKAFNEFRFFKLANGTS